MQREVLKLKAEMDAEPEVPKDLLSDIYYKLYHLAWIRADKENAFQFAERAAELHPTIEGKMRIYRDLATNALQKDLLDEAERYVEQCENNVSTNTSTTWYVHYLKGKLRLKRGDQKAALEEFTYSAKEANRMHLPYGEIAANIIALWALHQFVHNLLVLVE